MAQALEFLTKYFHHPDCPLGENGLRAYWEARDAFSSTPPEARATEADRIALAFAEQQLEDNQKCKCGCPGVDPVELELKCQQQEAAAEWTEPRLEED